MAADEPSEFELIERFRRLIGAPRAPLKLGAGDDAALLSLPAGQELVVSTDGFLQGVDFDFKLLAPQDSGRRCAVAALSDLAAMAAEPLALLVHLTVPRRGRADIAEALLQGLRDGGAEYGAQIAGGDTTGGGERWALTLTALGHAESYRATRRAGAAPGDELWVTGEPGWVAIGLELMQRKRNLRDPYRSKAIERFSRPQARIQEALWLTGRGLVKAMIDISDGLAGDLGHLCEAGKVAARLTPGAAPDTIVAALGEEQGWQAMLFSGEEFELLFASPAGKINHVLVQQFEQQFGLRLRRLGGFVAGSGIQRQLPDGELVEILARGFDHLHPERGSA
ncbi:MAG TPA: thiamine-phosphate kinase [Acidobacteriota bacterium]